MQKKTRGCFGLLLLVGACLLLVSSAAGQMRARLATLRFELGTGYDTNLFRIADQSDSNRVAAPSEMLAGRASGWLYWKKGVQTYAAASGEYSYYPGNTFANEWQWSAKTKTSFAIKRRPSRFAPAMNLEIALGAMQVDQLYTNRELGGEAYRDVNEDGLAPIQLGDLFDRKSYFFGGGMEFAFSKSSALSVGYTREVKDYANLGNPAAPNFYSLDNAENRIEAGLDVKPSKPLKIKLAYAGQDRQYDYRLARNGNGDEISNQYRRYWTNVYGVDASWNRARWTAKIRTSLEHRRDRAQGYYNSMRGQAGGDFTLAVSSHAQINLGLAHAWKNYERVTLAGNILSNRYLTFEAGISFALLRSLALQASCIHDRETSTFAAFSHRRNIVTAVLKYSL